MGKEHGPWLAPAKLNLMLRIVGRRADGYHELQTVFRFVDLADRLYFSITDDGDVRLAPPLPGVPDESNLAVRAARRLQAETGCRRGVRIRLDKRVPMGGGLGGGSSDAATALVALNRLWGLDLEPARLQSIGLELGADVPVFIAGRTAWAEGIGERLQPMELPPAHYLVAIPDCQVSTAEVFQAPELTRDSARITIRDFLVGDRQNDCLTVVAARYPAVGRALNLLGGLGFARLTGTGACCFVEFSTEAEARAAEAELAARFPVLVAAGLDRSPLYNQWPGG